MTDMTNDHPKHSPWGTPHDWQCLADGIWFVSTASHGGIWLSPDRRKAMPPEIRSIPTFAGGPWYEEDCDWALVALAFPEAFSAESLSGAIRTARHYHADTLDLDAYLATEVGQRCAQRCAGRAQEAA
jgi:hypothetical protein